MDEHDLKKNFSHYIILSSGSQNGGGSDLDLFSDLCGLPFSAGNKQLHVFP